MMGNYQKQGAVHGVTFFIMSSLVYNVAIQHLTASFCFFLNGEGLASSSKTFIITIELY